MQSLKSNIEDLGETVKMCFQFSGGNKKTVKGVISETIEQSEFTRQDLTDGRRFFVRPQNVDWFEVIKEEDAKDTKSRDSIANHNNLSTSDCILDTKS